MSEGDRRTRADATDVQQERRAMRRPAMIVLLIALLTGVFSAVVFFSTRHNDYPVYFHANSGPQAKEIITSHHNFHQPLLLVTLTKAAVAATGTAPTSQAVGEIGNWTAAALGGLAAAALTLLAFMLRGWLAAACSAVILGLCSPLIYYGHFFKEDTALAFGVAATFLALGWYWPRRTRWSIALVGAACGLAVAGKYIGITAALMALPAVMLARPIARSEAEAEPSITRPRAMRWFGLAMLATFFAVNYEALFPLKHFIEGVIYEVFHVTSGESDHGYVELRRMKPLAKYAQFLAIEMPWTVTVLAAIGTIAILARWRASSAVEKLMVLFAAAFFLMVTQSTVQQSRHMLPTWMLLHAIAAYGIVHIVSWRKLGRATPWALAIALLLPTAYVQWRHVADRVGEFPRDSRLLMATWIGANLPPGAKIAADTTCGLPDPEAEFHEDEKRTLACEVVTSKYAADLGTLDELLAQGYTHVAVARKRINQVTSQTRLPVEQERKRHERRVEFYRLILERGQVVWDSHAPGSIAPERGFSGEKLMLIQIASPPDSAAPGLDGPRGPHPNPPE
jgi:hypothetical protein